MAQQRSHNLLKQFVLLIAGFLAYFGAEPATAADRIINAETERCLANPDGQMKVAVRLVTAKCTGRPNQNWEFHADGRIVNGKSGLCMGVPKGQKKSGTGVFQAKCNGKKYRLWDVEFVGDATVVIRNRNSGLCLDFKKKPKKLRPKMTQVTCNGSESQQWSVRAAANPKKKQTKFDPASHVRKVMSIAENNFSANPSADTGGYFSKGRLKQLYSRDFASFYQRAAKSPEARERGGYPLDYDFLTGAQDGCPLKKISITSNKAFEHSWDVTVHFQAKTCFGTERKYQTFTKLVFVVIREKGKPVIDDIFRHDGGTSASLKLELDQIAQNQ